MISFYNRVTGNAGLNTNRFFFFYFSLRSDIVTLNIFRLFWLWRRLFIQSCCGKVCYLCAHDSFGLLENCYGKYL